MWTHTHMYGIELGCRDSRALSTYYPGIRTKKSFTVYNTEAPPNKGHFGTASFNIWSL